MRQKHRGYKYRRTTDCCEICGELNSNLQLEYHHIMPQSVKLDNKKSNISPLCHNCHVLVEKYYDAFLGDFFAEHNEKKRLTKQIHILNGIKNSYTIVKGLKCQDGIDGLKKKFNKIGYRNRFFTEEGMEKIINKENKNLAKISGKLSEKLTLFNWREFYESIKATLIIKTKYSPL